MRFLGSETTRRILRAVDNRHIDILAHPTGRLLPAREPLPVDMAAVFRAAAGTGIAVELDANPHRLDLDWRLIPVARATGVKVSINPGAHEPGGIAGMGYGLGIAREGGSSPDEAPKSLDLPALAKTFRR
jgi:DNA polymerase (family 10)